MGINFQQLTFIMQLIVHNFEQWLKEITSFLNIEQVMSLMTEDIFLNPTSFLSWVDI